MVTSSPATSFDVSARRGLSVPGAGEGRAVSVRVRDGLVVAADATDDDVVAVDTGPDTLLLPALANAHDHGRYFPPLSFGVPDQPLEPWLAGLALQPNLDPYLTALAYLARLARRGVASTMHMHRARPVDILIEEAAQTCAAAETVGVRMAFAVPLQDRNHVAYGCHGAGAGPLPDTAPPWRPTSIPSVSTLLDAVDEIAVHDSERVEIQYGPLGPQWVSDELLGAVAERSALTGRRIHMHLLETRRQREWADAAQPDGLVRHLDRLGLLSPRLSVAHGVWLRPDEAKLLAERGVVLVVNTSSNLRLRSGTAAVGDFVAAGGRFAMGLDGNTLDDDQDAFREMRLLALLQAGTELAPRVDPASVFRAAVDGATVLHRGPSAWGLRPGASADIVVLDTTSLDREVLAPRPDDFSLLMSRSSSAAVQHVWSGGRHVVRDGAVTGVDEHDVVTELLQHAMAVSPHRGHHDLPAVQRQVLAHYRAGRHQL